MRFRVSAPASAGNTGSAFDALGIAFGLWNEVVVDTDRPREIVVEGEGKDFLEKGTPNLIQQGIEWFAACTGRKIPSYGLNLRNRIPFGRGLGSSAAAIVSGLLAADALTGAGLSREELLRIALPMEGHPDNVAPALFGNAVLTIMNEGEVEGSQTVLSLEVPEDWRAVLYVPDLIIPTYHAREILPKDVPRRDAIFNHSRVGLLVAAFLQKRPELLRVAMQDRIHQPYRAELFPEMDALIETALGSGAWGACLSGAGSAILALAPESKAAALAEVMERKAAILKVPGWSMVLKIPSSGARVEAL